MGLVFIKSPQNGLWCKNKSPILGLRALSIENEYNAFKLLKTDDQILKYH